VTAGFGAYLHIPFCAARCDYCAFATWTDRGELVDRYMEGLRASVAAAAPDMPPVTSVFVGGGTPSLAPPQSLVDAVAELPLAEGVEITVECNPDTVTDELLATYRDGGVTRISLGVQSMVPEVLRSLGRTHSVGSVERAVAAVRSSGIGTFNLDVIYGGAGETVGQWERTLDAVLALEPPHVSAYALTVEPGTPLAADVARHPDDDDQAAKYERAGRRLEDAGLGWYEISNWARPGHECRHNLLTWAQGDYVGFGCAAHSHRRGRRWWNVRTPDRWLDLLERGAAVEAGSEVLDAPTRASEALELAIRTRTGVPAWALDPVADPELEPLVTSVADPAGGARWVLTTAGRLLANEVALRLRPERGAHDAATAGSTNT
jgi:oxygen-independent coproporphyrinogen-3 oxidase